MDIRLQEKYEEIKEKLPRPIKARCIECNTELITYLDVSYLQNKDERIKIFRPANCPECAELGGVLVKVIGELSENGEIYPKNNVGRPR